jgi:DNA-binding LytR/AlgR family response regulator
MKILIIEDEPFARTELIRLLDATGREYSILEQIDSIQESVTWLGTHPKPDLIFLDIQLADGISFEIFRQVNVTSPVIFTTAYDEYAIKAFQVNSIDYLLKPIRLEALENALKKLDDLRSAFSQQNAGLEQRQLDNILHMINREHKNRILIKTGDQIKSVEMEEVAYFYAEDDVVFAMLKNKGRSIVDYTLNQLEAEIDPKYFHRLTRGCIARITSIKKVSKYFNSRLLIELDPPMDEKLLVSRVNVPDFLKWLDQ